MISNKKNIMVIGVGRFGKYLTQKFVELGNEVAIADISEEAVEELTSIVANAQIGDFTNLDALKSLGVSNFDICFVCIGSNFQASLEITYQVKALGAKYVVAKANREIHETFLLRNGADEVVYPEREAATKTAIRFSDYNILDYIELTPEHMILEIPPLKSWIGHTVGEETIRGKYQINILATRIGNEVQPLPGSNHVFVENEALIVLSSKKDLERLAKER